MREVDAITKKTNFRKKWEDEKFDKVWYNESKKEWGKLSDNKMWNNKVKVKVKQVKMKVINGRFLFFNIKNIKTNQRLI